MRKRQKLLVVLSHMFSRKALGYRSFTVSWTLLAVLFWNYVQFGEIVFVESLEITLTIVIGKFIFYGVWEFYHLKEVDIEAVYDLEDHERIDMLVVAVDEEGHTHVEPLDHDDPEHV